MAKVPTLHLTDDQYHESGTFISLRDIADMEAEGLAEVFADIQRALAEKMDHDNQSPDDQQDSAASGSQSDATGCAKR